jgi:predicted enzyme related to lactoylglutathione lyase
MMKRENVKNVVNTMDVPSVDEFVQKITSNGGQIVMPKSVIPSVGYFAYCKDTEVNLFGIMQEDKSAK